MNIQHSRLTRAFSMLLSLILVASLFVGCAKNAPADAPQSAETSAPSIPESTAAPSEPETADALPKVGDELSGFVVDELIPMDALGATGVRFTHTKSGAQLLYLSTEDTNRSFDISFRTPALDDKGKPHIFEHITISGSQKYPDANLFFPFAAQTYSTFVNAMTYGGMTTFPLASLSEDQLMSMMDYYLSGVFSPLLYTTPELAMREAWRYELSDAEEELNIAGTVYSEMQGAMTASVQAMYNNISTLYPSSTTAHVSGGLPDAIHTLSYQELLDFHDAYYHPSNALIILYGKLDYARFLSYIDSEYLSKYERKAVDIDFGAIAPLTKTNDAEYEAPVKKTRRRKTPPKSITALRSMARSCTIPWRWTCLQTCSLKNPHR